jgi:electron transfer flavoprotein beta subunit
MKILIGIKRVVDYNVRVRVLPDGSGVDLDGVKMSVAEEVVVVSIGGDPVQQQLRTGLAMGADRAIQVKTDAELQPLGAAQAFLKIVEREEPGLVILGKQAIDDDNSQTGQMLAALWGRPQATFASKLVLNGTSARVTREVDSGLEIVDVDLPAVITVDLRLNEPRFVKLPDIMKAKRKPLDVVTLEELGVDAGSNVSVTHCAPPPQRAKGIMVDDAAQLVQELKNRGLL